MAATLNAQRRQRNQKIWSWRDWFKSGEPKKAKSLDEQRRQFSEAKRLKELRRKR